MGSLLFKRVLLTNDDGILGEGLDTLRKAAAAIAEEVWVVAPEHDRSGASASISLHDPLRFRQVDERVYAVVGTPCDAVIMGLRHVLKDKAPDLVMSGINRGINLSDDLLFSGTANAAIVASLLGCRAVAFSQSYRSMPVKWQTGESWVGNVLSKISDTVWLPGQCYNVNFPDIETDEVQGIEFVRQGSGSILEVEVESRIDRRRLPYFWFGFTRGPHGKDDDTDVAAIRRGAVAVTPLTVDRTNYELLEQLATKV
ncbi:MAG TPA: 5'/3'-nucleotidase SurE [Oculatellaceae cyanobacterium]